tara:strand:- start:233 stop:442 length:210 start_codon:yes stop_codon:yes gene_type:complete
METTTQETATMNTTDQETAQRRANRTGQAFFVIQDKASGQTCPFGVEGFFAMSNETRDAFRFVSVHNPT